MSASAFATAYPDKPITFVVPSAAGGSPDVLSRLITTQLARDTGATLVIENRPGAAGNIGITLVKRAAELNLTIVEDDPYGALSYKGEPMPKMVAMNPDGVIYMGSFSKVLTPGIRLGYVVAPLPLVRRLELAQALVNRPSLLILDEPTAVLTPSEADQLFGLLAAAINWPVREQPVAQPVPA